MTSAATLSLGPRVSVVGTSGSGKTYLSRKLGSVINLPLHSLDLTLATIENENSESEHFLEAVSDLVEADRWIIDGHYRSVREIVWSRASAVILLDYPIWLVLGQVIRRFLSRKVSKPSANVSETAGPKVKPASLGKRLRRLQKTVKERREYHRWLASPDHRHLQIVKLTSRRQAEQWLAALGEAQNR